MLPYTKYLQYLLIGGVRRWSRSDIISHLRVRRLPAPEFSYLNQLRSELEADRPIPYLTGSGLPQAWLEAKGLWGLACGDAHARQALRLLRSTEARPFAETLIIASLPDESVAQYLSTYVGDEEYTPQAIEVYREFFWNRGALTHAEWKNFLVSTLVDRLDSKLIDNYPGGVRLWYCYQAPVWYTQHLTGVPIEDFDMRVALRDVGIRAYSKLAELDFYDDPLVVANAFAKYLGSMISAYDKTGGGARLDRLLDQLKAFVLKQNERNFMPVQDLEAIGEVVDGRLLEETELRNV